MLDGHFYFSRKRVAVALEPDLLYAYCGFLQEMGCEVTAAVAPTQSAILEKIRAWSLLVGDHEDFETLSRGADLVVSNSHARMSVSRSGTLGRVRTLAVMSSPVRPSPRVAARTSRPSR